MVLSPGLTQPAVYTIRTWLGGPSPLSFPLKFKSWVANYARLTLSPMGGGLREAKHFCDYLGKGSKIKLTIFAEFSAKGVPPLRGK